MFSSYKINYSAFSLKFLKFGRGLGFAQEIRNSYAIAFFLFKNMVVPLFSHFTGNNP